MAASILAAITLIRRSMGIARVEEGDTVMGAFGPSRHGGGRARGGATAQIRGTCGAIPNSLSSPTASAKPKSPQVKGKSDLTVRRPRSGKTKKGIWGEETAGAHTKVSAHDGRAVAEPVGGTAAAGTKEKGATAQHLPGPLAAPTAH